MQENYENESSLTVDNTEISHTINLYGIKNSTVIIKGKINAVTMCMSIKSQSARKISSNLCVFDSELHEDCRASRKCYFIDCRH